MPEAEPISAESAKPADIPPRGRVWWVLIALWCIISALYCVSIREVYSLRYYGKGWGIAAATANGALVLSLYRYPERYRDFLGFFVNSNSPATYEYYTWPFGWLTHRAWNVERGMDGKTVRDRTVAISWLFLWLPLTVIIVMRDWDLFKARRKARKKDKEG